MDNNFIDDNSIKLANSHLYKNGVNKSVGSLGAQPIEIERKKKYLSKNVFRNIAIGVVSVALVCTIFIHNFYKNKNAAIDYITNNIVSEVSLDVNEDSVNKFINDMRKNGISEEVSLFYVKEIYGNEMFDKFVQTMGYKDGGHYMVEKGYRDKFIRNSYSGVPDEIHYNIDMSLEIIEEVDDIKESRMGK